ncbi:MAG TPA: hypothetical protein VGN17_26590 [Bryobacteraceae bacterium]|jgi:hypothetical protein
MAGEATCKLTPSPEDPECTLKAKVGDAVTLDIVDVSGSVLFESAKYNGQSLPGTPGKQITFTVVTGPKRLEAVYLFSDPVNGQAELHEVCPAHPFLLDILAADKAVGYTICTTGV